MEHLDVLSSIRRILRAINLESKRIQKEYGISIPQYLTLAYLKKCKDFKSTSSQMKTALNLNASTISGITSRLESKGLVARLPNKTDKRSSFIYLTALGDQLIENIPPLLHEKTSARLQQLSEIEVEQLQSSLQFLINLMGVENIDASPLITPEEQISQ
jgi:DNA-binding MarR family transcriptional regulator